MNDIKTGMVFLTSPSKLVPAFSVTTPKQTCAGEICIAIYVRDINRVKYANPAFGIVLNASGIIIAIIACDPASTVPKKNKIA